jgi:multidrug resistance efflux pump
MSEATAAFPATMGRLRGDRVGRSLALIGLGTLLLGGWIAWLFLARVPVWEVSASARVESAAAAHPVQTTIGGRIVHTDLAIGARVHAGQTLVELDAQASRLALAETTARRQSLVGQIARIETQIAEEEVVLGHLDEAAPKALDEASAHLREAESLAGLARETAKRVGELVKSHNISELEGLKAESELARAEASLEAQRLALDRLRVEQASDRSRQSALIDRLRLEKSSMEGDLETAAASLRRIEHEIDERFVRAPIDGVVAEVSRAPVGAVVREGESLAAIVPDGALRIVAEFRPQAALGRIREGQRARLRLAGFPALEYGTIDATVSSVATEVRDDLVRVELGVDAPSAARIPLQHGLPGSLEVEVERVSPASMILRAAGGRLQPSAPAIEKRG